MGEGNWESITPTNLTKEESLERLVWTLQTDFEELLEDNIQAAYEFLNWADDLLMGVKHVPSRDSKDRNREIQK